MWLARTVAVLACAAVVVVVVACGESGDSKASPREAVAATELRIVVWPRGTKGPRRSWTLRCQPVGGSLPRPARACARLAALRRPFRPTPRNVACSEIYGGPHVARVTGRLDRRRVRALLTRVNGCEIERWDRVRFLLPVRA